MLRFSFVVPPEFVRGGLWSLLWIVLLHAVTFRTFGLYKGIWVFASLPDLSRIAGAVGLVRGATPIPRSVLVAFPVFLVLTMGALGPCTASGVSIVCMVRWL
ncbi:MAG TPA: hypothetical protein VLC92_20600 [Rhodocyclaceae bacterium]|nr:hypothetical protein [Rhodocyclaceae bacterium]